MAIKDLILRIKGDSSSLQKETKKAEGTLSGFSKTAIKLGAAVVAAFAIRAISNFAKQAVQLAGIQQKAEAKVTQAVRQTGMAAGFTAEELKKMASGLQAITTFGDERILGDVTAQLLTFTNITGENFARTQKAALDLATLLDGDLKGASIQLGKALNDPIANLSALSRSGIQFSESQKTTIKGLVESNRLYDAQTIILDELNRQYGGQAEAMAKLPTGKIEQAKNIFGDLKEVVGNQLLPVVAKAWEWFGKIGTKAIEVIPKIIDWVRGVANSFIDLYNESEAFRVVIGVIGATVKTVFGAIWLAVKQVVTGVGTLGKVIGAAFRGQFKQIPIIIKEGFGKSIENIGDFGKKAAENFANGVKASKKAHLEPLKAKPEDQTAIAATYKQAGSIAGVAFYRGMTEEIQKIKIKGLPTLTAGIITEGPKEPVQVTGGIIPVAALARSMSGKDPQQDTVTTAIEIGDAYTVMGQQIYDSWKLAGEGAWDFAERMDITAQQIGDAILDLTSGFIGMFKGMANAVDAYLEVSSKISGTAAEMAKAQEDASKQMKNSIRAAIKGFIAEGVAAIIANTLKGSAGLLGPLALPIAGLAGAGAAALFGALIPSFAGGGIVDRPTLAMVGDNPGRKEAIIPSELWGKIGGGGNNGGRLYTEVSGRTLRIILDREEQFKSRT